MLRLFSCAALWIFSIAHADPNIYQLSDMFKTLNNPPKIDKAGASKLGAKFQWPREEASKNCFRDELQVYEIENSVLPQLRRSWLENSPELFKSISAEGFDFDTIFFSKPEPKSKIQFNEITKTTWGNSPSLSTRQYLNTFKEIADIELSLLEYTIAYETRQQDFRFDRVQALLNANIRGLNKEGERQSDVAYWQVELRRIEGTWRIVKGVPTSGISVKSKRAPAFTENTGLTGALAQIPLNLRTEAIRRGGYALAMTDMNKDGRHDILVGYRDGVALLVGEANGQFTDATKKSGLEGLKFVKTAVFADFRNKGVQDLVVTLLKPGKSQSNKGHTSVAYFHGDGAGHFERQQVDFGAKRGYLQPMPAAIGDFNGDGYLDLYVGYPGSRDFTVFAQSADTRLTQGLYLNDKKGSFADFTDQFHGSDYGRPDMLFPHASMAANFDQLNGIDLLVADDRGNLSPAYVSGEKPGTFRQVAQEVGLGNFGYAMAIAAGDYNNDGITDLLWTNVNFTAAQRATKACSRMWSTVAGAGEARGLRLFQGLGKGRFEEVTEAAGLAQNTGFGAAGATFLDYDNDGFMDIYLTNGLWSGSRKGSDFSTLFTTLSSMSRRHVVHGLNPEDRNNFKDLLRRFEGQISSKGLFKNVPGEHPSLAGFQHNRLFHNNGDGTFTDVAYIEGVDSLADGYVVGTYTNPKGQVDLILRNGDPGIQSTTYPVIQYFKNTLPDAKHSLLLTLEGSKSNRDAFGAFAIANFKNHKQVQHLIANTGSVQSQPILHFGLGREKSIPSLTIHWPSGRVQTLEDVKAGQLHIKEPSEVLQSQNK